MNEDMYKTSYTPVIEQFSSYSCSSFNLVISPIQQHYPLPRYGYQRDMLACEILAVTGRYF